MSYIAPNSTIYLYNNIDLDNSYKDTLYFETINEQNTYFSSTKPYKYLFTNQYYQRTNIGTLKIEKNAELIGDCNYMRFQNTREGLSKWYYAFITNWEYINENVTEISYQIDVMQTYLFDIRLEDSFIVRCHSTSDGINENQVMEDINIGSDYICHNITELAPYDSANALVILTTKVGVPNITTDPSDPDVGLIGFPQATKVNNVPNTVGILKFYDTDGVSAIEQATGYLRNTTWSGVPESIICAYNVPSYLAQCAPAGASYPLEAADETEIGAPPYESNAFSLTSCPSNFGITGDDEPYEPRNKKLLQYPYNYFTITNLQGQSVEFKYELFSGSPTFKYAGCLLPAPMFMIYPTNYRGITNDYNSAVILSDFPTVPITTDGYQQWLRHNAGKMTADALTIAISALSAGASAGLSNVSGISIPFGSNNPDDIYRDVSSFARAKKFMNMKDTGTFVPDPRSWHGALNRFDQEQMSARSNFLSSVAQYIGNFSDATRTANGSNGNSGGSSLMFALGQQKYRKYEMQIRKQQAEIIDTYFDMFGYQQNRVMPINNHARNVYTYVKTSGCNVVPLSIGNANRGVNARILAQISSIYDNGITFWKASAGYTVGDYSYNTRSANVIS